MKSARVAYAFHQNMDQRSVRIVQAAQTQCLAGLEDVLVSLARTVFSVIRKIAKTVSARIQ